MSAGPTVGSEELEYEVAIEHVAAALLVYGVAREQPGRYDELASRAKENEAVKHFLDLRVGEVRVTKPQRSWQNEDAALASLTSSRRTGRSLSVGAHAAHILRLAPAHKGQLGLHFEKGEVEDLPGGPRQTFVGVRSAPEWRHTASAYPADQRSA